MDKKIVATKKIKIRKLKYRFMIDVTRYGMQEDMPYFENTRMCDGEGENSVDMGEENI